MPKTAKKLEYSRSRKTKTEAFSTEAQPHCLIKKSTCHVCHAFQKRYVLAVAVFLTMGKHVIYSVTKKSTLHF